MQAVLFVPIVLSLLVLGAHFLRSGHLILVFGVFAVLALLPLRRAGVGRLVQATLLLGALEWVRSIVQLAVERSEQGEPFLRMVVILGIVATVTLLSGLLFESKTLRKRYGLRKGSL